MTNSLRSEALQHIDIAIAYIDLGFVDSGETILILLERCTTKQEVISVLIPLLSRYQISTDMHLTTLLAEFCDEILSKSVYSAKQSALSEYLSIELARFKTTDYQLPSFLDVFKSEKKAKDYVLRKITAIVLRLLQRNQTYWDVGSEFKTTTKAAEKSL